MKVLHVVTDMRVSNGIMSVVLNYARQMPEDVQFDIVYFKDFPDNRKADFEALGSTVYKLSRPGVKSILRGDWHKFFAAHRGEYAAIHIHAPHLACMVAPIAKRYGIRRVAVHAHSTFYSLFRKNKLRNRMLAFPVKHMKLLRIGCGREAGEFWYGKNNFVVLPNAVDCKKFRFDAEKTAKCRAAYGVSDAFVVGHLGRVAPPQKNHPFLLRIFAEILKQKPNAVLWMIGAEETDELRTLAASLGITDRISFLGSRNDVPELLAAMDVFVFPSFYEGLPVSVMEAQAAGLPVLMSTGVTAEAMCTDSIAALPLTESAKTFADAAIRLSEKGLCDTYERMCASGWDITETAKVLETFYREGTWK